MKSRTLIAASFAALALAMPAAYADTPANPNPAKFTKMTDTDKDGMVSKAEAVKMVEKMFDQADAKKAGKLDKQEVEKFLKMLMDISGGG